MAYAPIGQEERQAQDDRKKQHDSFAKLNSIFTSLNSKVFSTVGAFASVAAVVRGLQGTIEGNRLDYSIQHIFFEIADALRGPVRFLTGELEGLANVVKFANQEIEQRGHINENFDALVQGGIGGMIGHMMGVALRDAKNAALGQQQIAGSEHLKPLLKTSFGDVAGLQQRIQQLSTENPAQQRGLSLVETIYNVLVKIYNKLPGGGQLTEIPNPAIKKN
jgi:hypothetical protein